MLPQEWIDIDIPLESPIIKQISNINPIQKEKLGIIDTEYEDKSLILEVYKKGGNFSTWEHKESLRKTFVDSGFIKIDNEKIKVIPPTYKYNKFGFRSDEFYEDQEGIICLGCSDTFGQYQFERNTWPRIVAKSLGLKCYNLGIPGLSMRGTYFVLKRFIKKIKSQNVFLLTPSIYRFSYFDDENDMLHINASNNTNNKVIQNYYKHYINNPLELLFEYNHNLDAIRYLCHRFDKKLYIIPNPTHYDLVQEKYFDNLAFPITDRASDGLHMGKLSQYSIAQKFLTMFHDD